MFSLSSSSHSPLLCSSHIFLFLSWSFFWAKLHQIFYYNYASLEDANLMEWKRPYLCLCMMLLLLSLSLIFKTLGDDRHGFNSCSNELSKSQFPHLFKIKLFIHLNGIVMRTKGKNVCKFQYMLDLSLSCPHHFSVLQTILPTITWEWPAYNKN